MQPFFNVPVLQVVMEIVFQPEEATVYKSCYGIGFVISDLRPRVPIMPLGTVTVTSLCLVTSTEPPPPTPTLSLYLPWYTLILAMYFSGDTIRDNEKKRTDKVWGKKSLSTFHRDWRLCASPCTFYKHNFFFFFC